MDRWNGMYLELMVRTMARLTMKTMSMIRIPSNIVASTGKSKVQLIVEAKAHKDVLNLDHFLVITLNITIIWNEGAESVRAYIYMGIYIYGHMALERSQFWSYFHAQQSKRKCRCKNLSDHSHLRPTWYSHLIFTNKDFK